MKTTVFTIVPNKVSSAVLQYMQTSATETAYILLVFSLQFHEFVAQGMQHQAIFGDLNTMGHGIARFSPNFCTDKMRFWSLGQSEAVFWDRNIFQVQHASTAPAQQSGQTSANGTPPAMPGSSANTQAADASLTLPPILIIGHHGQHRQTLKLNHVMLCTQPLSNGHLLLQPLLHSQLTSSTICS